MEGPVLEEFIPIKKRASLDCDEEEDDDDEDEQHLYKPKISKDNNKKSDWLRFVQLLHPDPPTEEKMYVIEVKRSGSGGAFQPFHKEEKKAGKTSESFSKAPSSMPIAAASSTVVTVARDNSGSSKREEKDGQ